MNRRNLLVAAGCVPMAAAVRSAAAQGQRRQRPIVLVHGAYHGGWCWRDVRRILQGQGFPVFTPTLTGLGERVHLRTPDTNVALHIDDIVNVLMWEELTDVVLVGHSYAGRVVVGACDRLKDRIGHVIYLDTGVPLAGDGAQRPIDAAIVAKSRAAYGNDLPVPPPDQFGITAAASPSQHAWMKRRLTPHPIGNTEVPPLVNGGTRGVPRTFVLCTDLAKFPPGSDKDYAALKADPSWRVVEKLGPHDVMISDPAWTADLIAAAARA
jgi:pimeloyl-ACP methyl ester carboxylesterase